MAVTQNTYTGDGTTVLFSFTFPYLETTDIKVSLNGTVTTAYTLANATTIQFNAAPANGAAIRIYRQTDDAALAATFYPGSAIRSADLNENFTQNLYVTQESSNNATTATTTANTALTNSNTAISTANSAVSTANTASANASAAVSTANTASSNASAAVSTANTASSNATTAVNTANAATATANSATSTANTALSTANAATSTANAASTAATNAVNTANAASSAASSAVSTANTASTNASNAVTTANTASSNATTAVNTANSAVATANSAAAAVANAVIYTIVANVAAIPATPSNNTAIEVANSTGIESFTPLAGKPGGFVGNSGLSVRIIYSTSGSTWNWVQYFPNDPEARYLKLAGGTLTGALLADDSTSVASPVIAFDGDANTGIAHTGADELALVTGGTARVTVDPSGAVAVTNSLSVGGQAAVVTNDARLSDTRTPTDNTVSTAKIVDGAVTSAKIADGTIVNGDINASAAIAGTKISPDFGSQTITTTGVVSAAAGAAATPSIAFTGDLNTGIYSPGADQVAISTGGSGRLFIDSSGRVGIGATPGGNYLLEAGSTASASARSFKLMTLTGGFSGGDYPYFGYNLRATGSSGVYNYDLNDVASAINFGPSISFSTAASGTAGNAITWNERLRITSAGLVGVGTSVPGYTLDVQADTAAIQARSTTNGNDSSFILFAKNNGGTSFERSIVHDPDADALIFKRSTTEHLRIDNSGRLGIGTSTPGAPLSFADSNAFKIQFNGNVANYYGISKLAGGGSLGDGEFKFTAGDVTAGAFTFSSAGSEKVRIDNQGRVGIGSTTAEKILTVLKNGDSGLYIKSADTNHSNLQLGIDTANSYSFIQSGSAGSGSALNMAFFVGSTERARLDTSGRLLVGTSSGSLGTIANARLQVSGNNAATLQGTGGASQQVLYIWNNDSASNNLFVEFGTEATITTRGSIDYNRAAGQTRYNVTSDRRLKSDIQPASTALHVLSAIQVRSYRWNETNYLVEYGFIAQELNKVAPDAVKVGDDGEEVIDTWAVDNGKLVPLLTKALQEAIAKIETLEARLTAAGIA